ncbi:FAD-dependent oxidoreductase [Rubrivirga sp. SAORIC476]|uniref:phytoene desaturase family protein n=1 Tax=Rubrivirga sp. SAORIC476 TaxID=1961794 RepID=UPI000BA95A20|nr:NAD(P)/FAD-dependent oxidoreductase [Rubrivirga sp. SAORIC476]PAP82230.1 FAD-dependent oxidoreductase [Rubrivirga sp. SAORIC476]
MDYDLIVIGAGHNALISAAYAAKAGYRVGVFERRAIVGGAVSTVEHVPGYQFDLGGSAHILIRLTPIVEELGLEDYGLDYLEVDPLFFAPYEDESSVFIHRDVDKTCQGLDQQFPGEGERYRRFVDTWRPFSQTVRDVFLSTPSPLELGKAFAFGPSADLDWQRALTAITKPYGEVVDQYFTEEKVKTPLVWMAAQSGPPPTETLSAPFLLWHPLYHESGVARPRGGSGGLTKALAAMIRAHGGDVFTSSPVERLLVERGKVVGVEVDGEPVLAKAVLSGTHVLETLDKLLPSVHRPAEADTMRVGNGFGAILRLALDRPLQYAASPGLESRTALQLVCRDRQQIHDAYADYLKGHPAEDPPIVGMSFSAVDDTLAPPGGEVLWLWAQYFPYEMTGGRTWDAIEDEVADRILDTFEPYAPGTKASVVGKLFQHPLWLERELGLFRGNVMHLEMTIDQMFSLRPSMGLSDYRGPVDGLFLTGASMHPGGGIMGASGRNAARVVLKFLDSTP